MSPKDVEAVATAVAKALEHSQSSSEYATPALLIIMIGLLGFLLRAWFVRIDNSIGKIHKRIDDERDRADNTYVRRDMCEAHRITKSNLKAIGGGK